MQQVLDVPQRQRKPDLEHRGQTDDLRTGLEIPEREGLRIAPSYRPGRPASTEGFLTPPICIFPNDEASIRLVGALMPETNDELAVARRCVSLETIARVTENPTVRLPAVAA